MGIRIVSAVALLCACLSSPAAAQKIEWPTSLAPHPSIVAFDGSRIWVGHRDDATGQAVVSKLDAASGTLLLTVGGFVHVSGVAYDASTDSIWVADQGANTLTKLQALDGTVSLTVRDGLSMPMGILIDGPHVWVANFGSDSVSKLDAEGNVLGTFPTGSGPAFLAADADGNIWVTNYREDTVTKLSAEDGSVLGTFPTDAVPADGASRGTVATAEDPGFIADTLVSRALSNPCGGGAFALSGTSASCTFGPGSYNFIIPRDVWSQTIHVYGAQGGHAGPDQQGGYGGYVGASASVTPGYALVITVGGQGGSAFRNDAGTPCPYCAGGQGGGGGYNGGAPGGNGGSHQSSGQSGFAGGGGGGRSQVDFYANGEGHIIAGGGGGGGGNGGDNYCNTVFGITTCKRFPGGSGGFGGTNGSGGGNGHYFDGITGIGGGGGGGATASAGGGGGRGWYVVEPRGPGGIGGSLGLGGGASSGGLGTSFIDGNGNTFGGGGGGGGGGGYYGGGGGAGGIGTATLNDSGGGGGGGGGSSHWYGPGVLSITSASNARSGDGLVVVTWSLQTQTITFTSTPPSPGQAPGSYLVSAYGGGSGNPVVFSVSGACAVSGSTVSFSSAGTCTVYANQEGNGGYLDAGQVQQSFNIVQDTTPPVLAPTVTGTLGNNGWYTSDVQVSWSVTDPDSAISSSSGCGHSTVSADTTGTTFTCTATSAGGTASHSVTVKRDATAPVVTADASRPADHNGWYNHPLTVSFSGTDATSGVAACDAPQAYSGPDTTSTSLSGSCTDQAGNHNTGVRSFQYDATAPAVIASASRPADSNGWYNQALTITFTGTDATSGIAQCDAPKTYGGPDTASMSLSGSCSDQAGNANTGALTFKYDATAASVGYLGNAGSYTVDQTVNILCAPGDNLSGVASTTCQNITGPAYSFNVAANLFSATATDYAGNTGSGSTVFTVNVTTGGVCSLVQRFVANKGIANSLCGKLEKSKAGSLSAFENEVAAQNGKALTPAQAAVLVRLARVLSGQ